MYPFFTYFHCCILFYCKIIPDLSFLILAEIELLPFGAMMNFVVMHILVPISLAHMEMHFFWLYLRAELLRHNKIGKSSDLIDNVYWFLKMIILIYSHSVSESFQLFASLTTYIFILAILLDINDISVLF